MQSVLRHLGDATEGVGGSTSLSLPISVYITAAGSPPGLASETDTTKRPLRSIVREADATVVVEAGEAVPTLQPVFSPPSPAERTSTFALMGPAGKAALTKRFQKLQVFPEYRYRGGW